MPADLTLPPAPELEPGELLRRKRHLISEARRTCARTPDRRRPRLLALAVALALATVLSTAAFGIAGDVVSFFAGWREPDAPVPSAQDVLIASGKAGGEWKVVATTSDQGLCLALVVPGGGLDAGCGQTDVRGDPWAADARHWIGAFGIGAGAAELNRTFAYGPLAKEVASVELILTNGERLHAHVVERPEGLDAPLNFYWAAWPCGSNRCVDAIGPMVRMAIARDAAGRVLERRVPVWNGNPDGDPDGPPPPS